jgi:hypothetical protein
MGDKCRLVFQERICPAFEDVSFDIDSQVCVLGIQDNLNKLMFQAFTNAECLAEQIDLAWKFLKSITRPGILRYEGCFQKMCGINLTFIQLDFDKICIKSGTTYNQCL